MRLSVGFKTFLQAAGYGWLGTGILSGLVTSLLCDSNPGLPFEQKLRLVACMQGVALLLAIYMAGAAVFFSRRELQKIQRHSADGRETNSVPADLVPK